MFTYLGSGADRSWGRDLNASNIASAVDAVRDIFEYTGRPFDHTTGQQNSRHRWFDPASGQFTSKDGMGYGAGDANLYRYAGGDPANHTDPTGHYGVAVALGAIAVGSFAAGYAATGTWQGGVGTLIGVGAMVGGGYLMATGNWDAGSAVFGFGVGFIGGGMTGRGGWDWKRAAGFGLSGAAIGFGLSAGIRYNRDLGMTAVGWGIGGLLSQNDPENGFDWGSWGRTSAVGALAGLSLSRAPAAYRELGRNLFARNAAIGFGLGATFNAARQLTEMASGRRDKFDFQETLVGGGFGAVMMPLAVMSPWIAVPAMTVLGLESAANEYFINKN
ncbi:MAG: RHS repeat-associated core domain-containing protein, partial [Fimbriiglobus sp.]